ncbi:MAG: transcription termination factor Rho [Gammaproteobacteria bacterium]|nr:transcription termination factor Rho [Gammaproteobacteria bacterium]
MIKHRRRPHYANGQNNGNNGGNGNQTPGNREGFPADGDGFDASASSDAGGASAASSASESAGSEGAAAVIAAPAPQQQDGGGASSGNGGGNNGGSGNGNQAGNNGNNNNGGGNRGNGQNNGGGNNQNNNQRRRHQNNNQQQRGNNQQRGQNHQNHGGGNNGNYGNGNFNGRYNPRDEDYEANGNSGGNVAENREDAAAALGDPSVPRDPPKIIHISDLKKKTAAELYEMAETLGLENISRAKKTDIVFNLLRAAARRGDFIQADGVLEIMQDGYGFLRGPDASYLAGPDDVYISPSQIRRFGLRTGDTVAGRVRSPKDNERYFALLKVDTINYEAPEVSKKKVNFENLTPLFADERFVMERGNGTTEDITARVIDIVAPFGKGQRGLIVSPPKAGKTILMQNVAQSIAANYPDVYLIVLLIDERPEEVTDMQRTVRGEVISSTFDEPAQRHVQVADMVIEKAKRLVEHKRDVVILLDSITRLARAYNTVAPSSGKVLSGGVDANALQKPKRFFGAARNIEEGGSLTIIATALIDTGSKMDEVIYEEFKGTGNMELHLERRIAEKRVFPAININRSGTRKEELMVDPAELQKVWILRKLLHQMDELAAMELLFDRLRGTKTNSDFFDSMKRN